MKILTMSVLVALSAWAQNGTRAIIPEEVLAARPKAVAAKPVPASQGPRYNRVEGPELVDRASARQVGVTFWRLRAAKSDDRGARLLVQQEAGTEDWIPERISSTTALKAGDRVRLSLESPEAGYLYVVDRERYADGTRGPAFLIFPTTRTRGGDNKVAAGKLIDIPGQEDQPNFFTMTRSRPDQVEEEITVLLSASPLEGVQVGPKAMPVSSDQFEAWEKQWVRKVEVFELAGGAGKAWTAAEQQAGSGATRLLTQQDPPPQTVYRVQAAAGAAVGGREPLLVKLRLRYAAKR